MYLLNAKIENIRSIRRFELKFELEECPGWHVLIGDNGAGKTTMVQALALALIGPREAPALRQNWRPWLRGDHDRGEIVLDLYWDENRDKAVGQGRTAQGRPIKTEIQFVRSQVRNLPVVELSVPTLLRDDPYRYVWGTGEGWFCASYGPFRRFSGGDKEYEKLFYSHPKLAPHLSAFGEDVALTECLSWLQSMHVKRLEGGHNSKVVELVARFVNGSNLLPHGTILESVTSEGVSFRDGNGCKVDVEQLSDGYRSLLSLTFELIRQLISTYGVNTVFWPCVTEGRFDRIDVPGVVIIDEIDAHLHPTWQRQIGKWFTERFPQLQFIVTTHSPLVCQAAEKGSVWRLPTPGVEDDGGRITGTELKRLVYGNVLEAYGTEAFGGSVNRSESSKEKILRLAQLNQKSLRKDLSESEQAELLDLRSTLPTSAGTLDPAGGEVL